MLDARAAGPGPYRPLYACHGFSLPLDECLDLAAREVPHVARHAFAGRGILHEVAEADPLHAAADKISARDAHANAKLYLTADTIDSRGAYLHPDLEQAIQFHDAILAEAGKALVGYERPKALANVVLLSEIPTTYDKKEQRQVNAGNLLLRGVPGVGKTFFGVILAAISNARFARLQGRADLQPTEVVGFQMINPATGELVTEFGPLAEAEVILLDEINRIPLKSQSAFLEGLQDRTVTVGKTTYELPAFSFAIATMNPVELGQGTFPLSEAATDRFAIMVNIGYLPAEEERKLVSFDFKQVRLNPLMRKERIIELRSAISAHVFLHERLGEYIQRLVAATRPYNPEIDWRIHSRSELVERGVDLGASPRAIIVWARLAKVWALLVRRRDVVYPEDIQDLAPYILGHRIWLGPHAASHGLTTEAVINDVVERVPIP